MIIGLATKSQTKKDALIKALEKLNINDYQIINQEVNSGVSERPIGRAETLLGAKNRAYNLKSELKNFDLIIGIESGFVQEDYGQYIVNYIYIIGEKDSVSHSVGTPIPKKLYYHARAQKSVSKVFNKEKGLISILSNGFLNRPMIISDAIVTALLPIVFGDNYDEVSKRV